MDEFELISELPTVVVPEKVYTVAEITDVVKGLIENSVGAVWVEGEISNYKEHTSGHRYFSLKDENATLRCTIWRQIARFLSFEPDDGMRVRAYGRFSVYPPQGSYQLSISRLVKVGVGPLEIAFQKLKEKLLAEGLFETERKRSLPEFPSVVGVVTSATGAAFTDISETMAERFPGVTIVLCPARVQGEGAAEEIVAAIQTLNNEPDIDVIIAGRGGGSLEDLWPFNEEIVARAIAASRIPVISAVGHEVDFTIADGVADYRAATPTAAAQVVTDGWVRAMEELPVLADRIKRSQAERLRSLRSDLARLHGSHALRKPADLVYVWSQRLDDLTDRTRRSMAQVIKTIQARQAGLEGRLEALSPERVLARGYSITRVAGKTDALRRAGDVKPGATIETRLAEGTIVSDVTESGA